jgi:DNA-binding NtrC family response regulator
VSIPRPHPSADAGGPTAGTFSPATRVRERVLVIDDETNIRSTLAEFMALSGYEVDTAQDGRHGMDLLGGREYDLVLLDLRMPGMDGIAVTEWIRETHPDVPVIVMTGHATVESSIRALRLGAYDYVQKPFTLDEIERTIGNCLEKRRLASGFARSSASRTISSRRCRTSFALRSPRSTGSSHCSRAATRRTSPIASAPGSMRSGTT